VSIRAAAVAFLLRKEEKAIPATARLKSDLIQNLTLGKSWKSY